jgi:hypothetical protein
MGKKDAETIKSLYSIMYGRRFQQKNVRVATSFWCIGCGCLTAVSRWHSQIRTIKEHILDFSGIPNADEKVRLKAALVCSTGLRKELTGLSIACVLQMRQQLVGKMGRWMRSYVQDIMDLLGVRAESFMLECMLPVHTC